MDILERARAEIEAAQEPHTPSERPLAFADAAANVELARATAISQGDA
jgi:hypothetical protein